MDKYNTKFRTITILRLANINFMLCSNYPNRINIVKDFRRGNSSREMLEQQIKSLPYEHYMQVECLFSTAKIAPLKKTARLLTQTSRINVYALVYQFS